MFKVHAAASKSGRKAVKKEVRNPAQEFFTPQTPCAAAVGPYPMENVKIKHCISS